VTGSTVVSGQVYCPFLWRHWATGWYTLRSLRSDPLVLTNQREYAADWPWPTDKLVRWDFSGRPPRRLSNVDVFHVHNGWTLATVGLVLQRHFPRTPFVATVIGSDVNVHARDPEFSPGYRAFFERATAIVAISQFLRGKLVSIGCPPEKIRVIPLGVSPEALPARGEQDFSGPGRLRACIVARLIEWKGVDDAMLAVAKARASGADVTLDVVGSGPEHGRLARLAREIGSFVQIHGGEQEAVPHRVAMSILARADCVLNCSRRMTDGAEESLGVSVIEGQMLGLPAVCYDTGGVGEIVEPGCTGLLGVAHPGADGTVARTVDGMAGALVSLADDRAKRVSLGRAARLSALSRFSAAAVASRLDALYEELADAAAPSA
jgi:colanic acid/amylovoran biosynthesis glycosyltransferase